MEHNFHCLGGYTLGNGVSFCLPSWDLCDQADVYSYSQYSSRREAPQIRLSYACFCKLCETYTYIDKFWQESVQHVLLER